MASLATAPRRKAPGVDGRTQLWSKIARSGMLTMRRVESVSKGPRLAARERGSGGETSEAVEGLRNEGMRNDRERATMGYGSDRALERTTETGSETVRNEELLPSRGNPERDGGERRPRDGNDDSHSCANMSAGLPPSPKPRLSLACASLWSGDEKELLLDECDE